jgi:hypothetical protein
MARMQQPATHEGPLVYLLIVVLFLHILTHELQYDHVDPTEFQSLKDKIESSKGEKSAWETEWVTHTSCGFISGIL